MSEHANLFVWRHDRVVALAVAGEIDVANARRLEAGILAEVGAGDAGLVIDLSGLTFMDSAGVHLLFNVRDRLRERGLGFALVLPRESPPRRVLELSGPEAASWIHTEEDAAVAAVLSRCSASPPQSP